MAGSCGRIVRQPVQTECFKLPMSCNRVVSTSAHFSVLSIVHTRCSLPHDKDEAAYGQEAVLQDAHSAIGRVVTSLPQISVSPTAGLLEGVG